MRAVHRSKKSIGADRDVAIRYGKNLSGLEVNEDESDVRTRVLAYGKNDIFTAVDSPHLNDYVYPKLQHVPPPLPVPLCRH